ncbi:MAG: hypothetical protein Q3972_04110 [Corynebacterium sp.]|nr:hypothetical protein [Corynebacterium sp.]
MGTITNFIGYWVAYFFGLLGLTFLLNHDASYWRAVIVAFIASAITGWFHYRRSTKN